MDVNGSYRYAARLHELGVPVEMRVYLLGKQGLGLVGREDKDAVLPYAKGWVGLLINWLSPTK